MKRLLYILIAFVAGVCGKGHAQTTTTPYIGLQIPAARSTNWNVPLNFDFTQIDGYLGGQTPVPSFKVNSNLTVNGTGNFGVAVNAPSATFTSLTTTSFNVSNGNSAPAFVANSSISSLSVVVAGTVVQGGGFQSTPSVAVIGGSGSGATMTPNMSSNGSTGIVQNVNITNPGSCPQGGNVYSLTFTGGGGSGAAAYVYTSTSSGVTSVVMQSSGYGYTTAPTVTLTSNACTGTAFTPTMASTGNEIASATLAGGGSGYAANTWQNATISGGGGSGAVIEGFSNSTGAIATIAILNQGTGYTSAPTVTFPTSGTPANVSVALGGPNITINSLTVSAQGSGYTSQPAIAFGGGGGCAPQFNVTVSGGAVTGITVPYGGCGFNRNGYASLYLIGGGGTGATAVVNSQATGAIQSVAVTNGGSGYGIAPTVYVWDSGGSFALANAVVSGTGTTNNYTSINSAGTGAVVINGLANAGTGGLVVGSGGAAPAAVATVSNTGLGTFNGGISAGSSGSTNKVVCWKDTAHIGYCSTQPDTSGNCTCN